jgi:hypothetical protein
MKPYLNIPHLNLMLSSMFCLDTLSVSYDCTSSSWPSLLNRMRGFPMLKFSTLAFMLYLISPSYSSFLNVVLYIRTNQSQCVFCQQGTLFAHNTTVFVRHNRDPLITQTELYRTHLPFKIDTDAW